MIAETRNTYDGKWWFALASANQWRRINEIMDLFLLTNCPKLIDWEYIMLWPGRCADDSSSNRGRCLGKREVLFKSHTTLYNNVDIRSFQGCRFCTGFVQHLSGLHARVLELIFITTAGSVRLQFQHLSGLFGAGSQNSNNGRIHLVLGPFPAGPFGFG